MWRTVPVRPRTGTSRLADDLHSFCFPLRWHLPSIIMPQPRVQEPTFALFGVRSWHREEITIVAHSVELEAKQTSIAEKKFTTLWIEVDFMGVDAKTTGMVSERVRRKVGETAPIELDAAWKVR